MTGAAYVPEPFLLVASDGFILDLEVAISAVDHRSRGCCMCRLLIIQFSQFVCLNVELGLEWEVVVGGMVVLVALNVTQIDCGVLLVNLSKSLEDVPTWSETVI